MNSSWNCAIASWERRRLNARLVVHLDPIETFLHGGEHPERQEIDLDEAGVVTGVLVPLADEPPFHRGTLDGNHFHQRARGDDHPADVLREVAGEAAQFAR